MWPSLKRFTWLEMPRGILTPAIAREIINRLDGRSWSGRYTCLRDVYVSRGWRPKDLPFADAVCKAFCEHRHMLRLIGDMPDQKSFSKDRIREILSSCCGHLVILPRRSPTEEAYKYIIQELTISAALGIPTLLIAEEDTPLPESLDKSVNRLAPNEDYTTLWSIEPPEWMELFKEDLKEPLSSNHLFLAAEFKENMQWVTQFREFIESVTGLPCYIGRDFEGQGLRDKIVSSIASATIVIANLANFEETSPNKNSVNLNTCVEAGIALGASNTRIINGLKSLPVFLISQSSPDARGRTAQLPFMFRDSQITWYSNHVELLGQCRRLLQPYRRRIINYEFAKSE